MLSKFPRNPLIYLAPLALLFAAFSWLPQTDGSRGVETNQYRTNHFFAQRGEAPSINDAQPVDMAGDREDRRPPKDDKRRGGSRHHGPPPGPPCGVPPTVLFLIGGALGFLLGRKRPGCGPHHGCGPRHGRGPHHDGGPRHGRGPHHDGGPRHCRCDRPDNVPAGPEPRE